MTYLLLASTLFLAAPQGIVARDSVITQTAQADSTGAVGAVFTSDEAWKTPVNNSVVVPAEEVRLFTDASREQLQSLLHDVEISGGYFDDIDAAELLGSTVAQAGISSETLMIFTANDATPIKQALETIPYFLSEGASLKIDLGPLEQIQGKSDETGRQVLRITPIFPVSSQPSSR